MKIKKETAQISSFSYESESEVAQSCPTFIDPKDCSLPGFSLHGILQARVLEWVAISSSRGSSWPRNRTWVSCIPGKHFNLWATREVSESESHSVMSDSLRPHELYSILQARILEWLAFPFSRGSSQPRDGIQVSYKAGRCFTNREVLTSFSYKNNNSLMNFPSPSYHLSLCTSQRSCLQIPSRWG